PPVPAGNGWGTSASKATPCCATCWWRPPRRLHASTRTGGVGTCTWRCVGTRALPRLRWVGGWQFVCTGCGETDVSIRLRLSSVRTWESPKSGMAEVERRPHDWASRSLQREFEEVIMVEVVIEEMSRSD